MKYFRNTFLENYESQKTETKYKHEQWVDLSCLPKLVPKAHNSQSYVLSIFSFYVLICH